MTYRVLHTLPALDGGGAERIVYDYVSRMSNSYTFDFIVHTRKKGILEDSLISKGCHVFHVPPLHENKKEYKRQIKDILKRGKYDIIHVSQGYKGLFFLKFAKKANIKVRIAHSHMAFIPETFKERIIRKICTFFARHYATCLFACGADAAKWMWGEKIYKKGGVYIMKNAIDTSRFLFSLPLRKKIRKEYRLSDDAFVIGNIARFSFQKNHIFLMRVFSEYLKHNQNSYLFLIGGGELENDIKKTASDLKIDKNVIFTGIVDNPNDYYNCFDLFLLPSRFEGLPVVLIEALINGVPTVVSNSVTKEFESFRNFKYLDLVISDWVDYINNDVILPESVDEARKAAKDTVIKYDLGFCADALEKQYYLLLGKRK